MNKDVSFMRMALDQARQAKDAGEIPVGAVVVRDGRVIAVGRNMSIASHDPSAHAEIVALRTAAQALGNYRLDGCELFVTLEPCPMCAGAILHSRLKRLVFGASDPKTGAVGSVLNIFANQQLNHQTQVCGGTLSEECSGILRDFFKERRKEQALQVRPLMDDAVRTPESVFSSMEDFPFASCYHRDTEHLRGWHMHFLDEGPSTAPTTVLCLHDMPGWSYRYRGIIPILSMKGIRVISPDLIGFGKSDKPKKASVHTVNLHLRGLQSLLAHLGVQKIFIVAEGLGIHLAQALAFSRSVSVTGLLQISTEFEGAPDMRPFPHKGYQAALTVSSTLAQQFRQGPWSMDSGFEVGAPHMTTQAIAQHIEMKCHSG
ncbi:tRNA adenosine(34) deaminase TadA [Rhodoferax sp.]|uniref:tRNA adenosine(34) deaminase TadA n=1 Tax=Rhodoferax sp. TaxID=50421 RepID=UPI002ACD5CAF|nr:tRNA adenosine(34) deaminase TadA [Rhodoferax sp.]MDZ7919749.1 tRNA adenosine(34) deaminase TadA [Rhodoferax sp.]